MTPSDQEPAASTRYSKRQKSSKAAAVTIKARNLMGDESMQPLSSCKSFYLQESFIISSSKYFRTRFETAVGGLETEMSTVGRLRTIVILHDYIEEGEMQAVELVLKSFYAMGEPPLDTLPSTSDDKVHLLLKALMVAERYQAGRCKEKVAEALSAIPASNLTLELAKAVHAVPRHLLDSHLMSRIKQSVMDRFYLEMFSNDVVETIKDAQIMDIFLALPYDSILSWIKRDDLKVNSKNDVVYLLNKWIENNKPSSDQMDSLIKGLGFRFIVNLGPAYLHSILPNLEWFKESSLHRHHHVSIMSRDSKAIFDLIKRQFPDLPPSWLFAPRKAPGYTRPPSIVFTWILNEDQLKLIDDGKTVLSEPFYLNGHWFNGVVQQRQEPGAGAYSLFVGTQIHQPFLQASNSLNGLSHTISIDEVGEAPSMSFSDTFFLSNDGSGWGWADFLHRQCPTIQEVVAPYLVDGMLAMKFEISKVDRAPVISL